MSTAYRGKNITTQTTTQVTPGPAKLLAVNVNTGATSAVCTIYDATAGTTNVIATIDASSKSTNVYGIYLANGIRVVTSGGNADITITYE